MNGEGHCRAHALTTWTGGLISPIPAHAIYAYMRTIRELHACGSLCVYFAQSRGTDGFQNRIDCRIA